VFPGRGRGESAFTIYEDDGLTHRHRDGDYAELECMLQWTPSAIRLRVKKRGRFALPYPTLRIVAPPAERRALRLEGEDVALIRDRR
jgi:hypothetical protein